MQVLSCLLFLLTACLALFTDRAQCMFGQVYLACSVHVGPCLLNVLSACLALFTERAQYMFGPVY